MTAVFLKGAKTVRGQYTLIIVLTLIGSLLYYYKTLTRL